MFSEDIFIFAFLYLYKYFILGKSSVPIKMGQRTLFKEVLRKQPLI